MYLKKLHLLGWLPGGRPRHNTSDCREGTLPTDAKHTNGGRYYIRSPPKMRALNLVTNAHTMQPCAHK